MIHTYNCKTCVMKYIIQSATYYTNATLEKDTLTYNCSNMKHIIQEYNMHEKCNEIN